MNTPANVGLLITGIAGISAAIELAKAGMIVPAIVAGTIGLGAVLLYELFPSKQ